MPRISDRRVSVSKERAAEIAGLVFVVRRGRRPAEQRALLHDRQLPGRGDLEEGAQRRPRQPLARVGLRAAPARRSTATPLALRLTRISIYGDTTPNLDALESWPLFADSVSCQPGAGPSTVETREGFRTEAAVAKRRRGGRARPACPDARARRPAGSTAARAAAAAPAWAGGTGSTWISWCSRVTDGLGGCGNLRGRNSWLGIPHPYLGRRRVHGERCERHDHHQTGATGHIRTTRSQTRATPTSAPRDTYRGHRRGNCHVLFAGLYRNIARRRVPAAVDCSGRWLSVPG